MWRNSDFKIYFSVLKIYFKAMVPPYMLVRKPRRRVLDCFSCVVSPVEALLCGSVPRRIVLWRFLCVVSWEGVLLCGSVPRRKVSGCFSCVVSYLMSSSVVKGWVKQARDEVSDQKRMMRISGATRYGVVRMKRSHWAMKYVTRTR